MDGTHIHTMHRTVWFQSIWYSSECRVEVQVMNSEDLALVILLAVVAGILGAVPIIVVVLLLSAWGVI